jgi:hypothetical protein
MNRYASPIPPDEKAKAWRRRRQGRIVLAVVGIAATIAVLAPEWLRSLWSRDICPTEVTERGETAGVTWDIARSDCADRTVWQMRIVPQKGVSTLVYEAEGGPLPRRWRQTGFQGTVVLAAPLVSGESEIGLKLDLKGRPEKPIRVKSGQRID